MRFIYIKQILQEARVGERMTVRGWVRTKRQSKNVSFINVNDGSTIHNLQAVVEGEHELLPKINTGACVSLTGTLVESQGQQKVELKVEDIRILGEADPEQYPLQPKKHSLEFLREIAHLRFRTNTFGAIFRVRNSLAFAVHRFFQERGFVYLHTPVITASDAEGAGETFHVTNFDLANPPKTDTGEIDYRQDFFGKATNLTVSGQLEGELGPPTDALHQALVHQGDKVDLPLAEEAMHIL